MTLNYDLFARLSEAQGIPGQEGPVRRLIAAELDKLGIAHTSDSMGNLFTRLGNPNGRRVMLVAHMDEIGFVVHQIEPGGFVRLLPLGGHDPRNLAAQRLRFHGPAGTSRTGVVGIVPKHILGPNANTVPAIPDYYIDLGIAEEEVRRLFPPNSPVTFETPFEDWGEVVCGKAFDDRVGCFVLLETLRQLAGTELDLHAVFAAQEEMGMRGSTVAGYAVEPEIAIALEGTPANDTPGSTPATRLAVQGDGPAVRMMDGGSIAHPGLVRYLARQAERIGIRFQYDLKAVGATDAAAIQRTRAGAATTTIGVPCRYIHSPIGTARKEDIENAVRLLLAVVEKLPNAVLAD